MQQKSGPGKKNPGEQNAQQGIERVFVLHAAKNSFCATASEPGTLPLEGKIPGTRLPSEGIENANRGRSLSRGPERFVAARCGTLELLVLKRDTERDASNREIKRVR